MKKGFYDLILGKSSQNRHWPWPVWTNSSSMTHCAVIWAHGLLSLWACAVFVLQKYSLCRSQNSWKSGKSWRFLQHADYKRFSLITTWFFEQRQKLEQKSHENDSAYNGQRPKMATSGSLSRVSEGKMFQERRWVPFRSSSGTCFDTKRESYGVFRLDEGKNYNAINLTNSG